MGWCAGPRLWWWRSAGCRPPGRWVSSGCGQCLGGEPAGADGLEEVVYGAGEGPFGAGFGLAAHGELPEAHVVLDVAVRGLGDVAAVAVGGDAVFGGQPGGHRRQR